MAYPIGESKLPPLRVTFDRRLKLEFNFKDVRQEVSNGG